MQICKRLAQRIGSLLPKGAVVAGLATLFVLPLTLSAKEVLVWELDNFFSRVENGAPIDQDGFTTTVEIEEGDTVKFVNMGATDHDAGNQFFESDEGDSFFDKDLFGSSAQAPGDTFTTDAIDLTGTVPFVCFIHGADDMAGSLVVSHVGGGDDDDDDDDDNGTGNKSFTFKCGKALRFGPAGLETLVMSLGESESCKIRLTDLQPNKLVEVSTVLRAGFISSISIDPVSAMTDDNGELDVTVTATRPGIDWVAWGIPNNIGELSFSKKAYDNGLAWGMFVEVRR